VTNVLLIMQRELASYTRTLSGWLIAAFYLICNAIVFNTWAVGDEPSFSTDVLQRYLWAAGWTTTLAAVLFTMRLLAEERHNGTQTLLFTSPIREGEIVMGKYLATLLVLTVVILLSLYLPALIFVNGKVSVGHIAAGYLGLVLLGATVLALGTFASALVPHPFLAVLLNAFFVFVLEALFYVATKTEGDWGTVLGYFSAVFNHFQPLRRGLLQLSDLVYYGTLIYAALLAATRVMKSQRWG
jgi:ABC-2 type transport system permease protein